MGIRDVGDFCLGGGVAGRGRQRGGSLLRGRTCLHLIMEGLSNLGVLLIEQVQAKAL